MTLRSLPTVRTPALAAVLAIGAIFTFLTFAGKAAASTSQFSIMQDDRLLIHSGLDVQAQSLSDLDALGFNTIHTVVNWRDLAPSPDSSTKPAGFDGSKPSSYDPAKWDIFDGLVRGAQSHSFNVLMSPAGPAPVWAEKCNSRDKRRYPKGTCRPDPKLYADFVKALATRYSGAYHDENSNLPLPAVKQWSIWNEPNLKSWLSPAVVGHGRHAVDVGASVYRGLAYAALGSLKATGHIRDLILLGETAPIGGSSGNATPSDFYHGVFCEDSRGHRLRGKAAKKLGCKGKLKKMQVSGFAHHPYTRGAFSNLLGKQKAGNITISYIPRMLHVLHDARRSRAISSKAARSIYWTEFGVSSRPPASRGKGVSLAKQAEWINQMQFMSYINHSVRSVAQFQISDDAGLSTALGGKGTFQTGLRFSPSNRPKPAYDAYRVPLYVVDLGHSVEIWGGARPAGPRGEKIDILLNGKTVKTVGLSRFGYFITKMSKRSGTWQLKWTPAKGGGPFFSRKAKAIKKKKAIASRK